MSWHGSISSGERYGLPRTCRLCVLVLGLMALTLHLPTPADARILSSLLLLIDTSGSMDGEIGNGNVEIKLEAAKQAAIAAVDRATSSGTAEVAVLAFEGGCHAPVSRYIEFTTDVDRLTRFIDSLQTGAVDPYDPEAAAVLCRCTNSAGERLVQ